MDNSHHLTYSAFDRTYLAFLKREVHQLAIQIGFTGHRVAEIDLVVAEIASNLIKHASGGELLVRHIGKSPSAGLEIIGIDNGPGMVNTARMLEDGISTTNTLGHGLGSIQRLSDEFSLYSQPKWGTIILSRVYVNEPPPTLAGNAVIRSLLIPKTGETVCGDGFATSVSDNTIKVFLGDGLGHGPEAHKAIQAAKQAFRMSLTNDPVQILQDISRAVTKTRGLVGTVAILDRLSNKWKVCGVGNITARLHNQNQLDTAKTFLSYNGILGLNMPRTLNEQVAAYQRGQILVMGSDGLKSRWDVSRYPTIRQHDPSVLAAALYKDYARRTDDTSVVVVQLS